jgi:hypothetical protein
MAAICAAAKACFTAILCIDMSGQSLEVLLGFDAREMWMTPEELMHPSHKRSTFLLRDDAQKVLSADTMVWPSLFNESQTPQWIGANRPLWENLDLLKRSISTPAPYRLIAATWHAEVAFSEEKRPQLGPYDLPTTPQVRNPEWRLLGFDICDGSLLSGLSNCGYTEEERRLLVPQWASRLNDNHLFEDITDAFQFRSLTSRRVIEHGPFFVIGLWQVQDRVGPHPAGP